MHWTLRGLLRSRKAPSRKQLFSRPQRPPYQTSAKIQITVVPKEHTFLFFGQTLLGRLPKTAENTGYWFTPHGHVALKGPVASWRFHHSWRLVSFREVISAGEAVSLPRPRIRVVHGMVPPQYACNALPALSDVLYRPAVEGQRCPPLPTSSTPAPKVTPN